MGQLVEIVAVLDASSTERLTRMRDRLLRTTDLDFVAAHRRCRREALPATRYGVPGPFDLRHRAAVDAAEHRLSGLEGVVGEPKHLALVLLEALQDVVPFPVALLQRILIERRQERTRHGIECFPSWDRGELLQPNVLATALHTAFVVPLARTRKAGLEEVVAHQGLEARRELPLREEHLRDRGLEIVVHAASRDDAEVSERANVAIQERDLVAVIVEPGEVAP